MKQTKATKLAYLAGFIDGEGCIMISKRNPRMDKNGKDRINVSYSVLLTIAQRDGAIMDWLVGNYGGSVQWKDRENPTYNWIITHKKASIVLKEVLPFLKYKKHQAELALKLQGRLKKTLRGQDGKAMPLADNEIKIREKIYLRCRELKHIYKESKYRNKLDNNGAAVTTKCDNLEIGSDSLTSQE